jgi:hypothetical protein
LSDPRGVRTIGCRGPWDETIEPDWFAKPTSPRTLGFSCSRVELPLLTHPWLLTSSRVACCFACALACGIEPSQPPVERSRSHPRMRQSNSTQTSRSSNFAAGLALRSCSSRARRAITIAFASPLLLLSCRALTAPSPPRGPRPACIRITTSAAVRARPPPFSTSSSQCRLTSSAASSSTVSDVLHAWLYCPRADPPVAATLQLLPHRV